MEWIEALQIGILIGFTIELIIDLLFRLLWRRNLQRTLIIQSGKFEQLSAENRDLRQKINAVEEKLQSLNNERSQSSSVNVYVNGGKGEWFLVYGSQTSNKPEEENNPYQRQFKVKRPFELTTVWGIGPSTAQKLSNRGINTFADLQNAVENGDKKVWETLTEKRSPNWVLRGQRQAGHLYNDFMPWNTDRDFYKDSVVKNLWQKHIAALASGNEEEAAKYEIDLENAWGNPRENFESICGIDKNFEEELYKEEIITWAVLADKARSGDAQLKKILTSSEPRQKRFAHIYRTTDADIWLRHIKNQAEILASGEDGRYKKLAIYKLEICGPPMEKVFGLTAEMIGQRALEDLKDANAERLKDWFGAFEKTLFLEAYERSLAALDNDDAKWDKLAELIQKQVRLIEAENWESLYNFQRQHGGPVRSRITGELEEAMIYVGDPTLSQAENDRHFNEFLAQLDDLSYADIKNKENIMSQDPEQG